MQTLHVLNGDATREKLELAGIPGVLTVWADVLHDGPVPNLPPSELRRVRAQHLEPYVARTADDMVSRADAWDAALDRYGDYDELVFWFEHDLFDQLILIRHLHWLSQIPHASARFSLICIGAYPGRPNFAGLGELAPSELAGLFPLRRPITWQQIVLGTTAWDLFRAAEPTALLEWLDHADLSALPYLDGALRRHLDDFPSTMNGLSRSESQILKAVVEGQSTAVDIFVATQRMEERVFMGDLTFWSIIRRLAGARTPLVSVDGDTPQLPFTGVRVEITRAGREVLAGEKDHVELNGIDRWMGGAHLTTARHWRWDGELLTSTSKGR